LDGTEGLRERRQHARAADLSRRPDRLERVAAAGEHAGARPEHLVRLTWFVTNLDEYRAEQKEIGAAYRDVIGRHYPPMSVVQVVSLVEPGAKVEIEATAVIPD
jgi:enamine deaminase RidA (YjgF/YER057c/UK114 family)